jgi:hypothetical protein
MTVAPEPTPSETPPAAAPAAAPVAETPPVETPLVETPPAAAEPAKSLLNETPADAPPEATPFDFTAVTIPEGLTVSEEQQTSFAALAQEHGISAEAATALFAMYGSQLTEQAGTSATALQTEWTATNDDWREKTKAELGPEMGAVTQRIGKMLVEFGDDEFRTAMDFTGAGNHPAVVRMLNKLAVAIGEGGPVNPAGQPNATPNPLQSMYPTMTDTKGS